MANRMQRVVDRLLSDRAFLDRFRQDPESSLRPYRLSSPEMEALKEGDAARLEQLGVHVQSYYADPPTPSPSLWLSSPTGRQALATLGAMVLALGIVFGTPAPVHAARKRAARARRLQGRMVRMVRRAKRADVRAGLYLRRTVRHLGLRHVKGGDQADPCVCVEPIR